MICVGAMYVRSLDGTPTDSGWRAYAIGVLCMLVTYGLCTLR